MPQKANNATKGYKTTKGQQDHKRSTIQPHNRLGFQGTQEKQAHKLELAESLRRTQTYAPNARASPSLPNSNKATKAIGGIREEEHKTLQDLDPNDSFTKKGFDLGDCRSRSPLSNPSKRCKNHRREGRGRKLKEVNNGGQKRAQEP